MSIDIKNRLMLVIGAISLIALGALGTWGVNKIFEASVSTAIANTRTSLTEPPAPVRDRAYISPETDDDESSVDSQYVTAKVIKVRPHYVIKTIPYERCRQVPQTIVVGRENPLPGAGTVIGGVAGGIVGNQIGQGRGNIAATVGGAIVGAVVGNQVEGRMSAPEYRTIYTTVCKTRYTKKSILDGYEVTYVYNGHKGKTVMKNPPEGDTIPLSLNPIIR